MHAERKSLALVVGAIVVAGVVVIACSDDSTTPSTTNNANDSGSTTPPGSNPPSGTGTTPVNPPPGNLDAGHDAEAGDKVFGDPCGDDTECQSGVCANSGGGTRCTKECTDKGATNSADCQGVDSFTGKCNNMGFCQNQ